MHGIKNNSIAPFTSFPVILSYKKYILSNTIKILALYYAARKIMYNFSVTFDLFVFILFIFCFLNKRSFRYFYKSILSITNAIFLKNTFNVRSKNFYDILSLF